MRWLIALFVLLLLMPLARAQFARKNVRGVWAYDCKPAWDYRAEKR